jgi:hypothetical protein
MSVDRRSAAWAAKYQEMLKSFTNALGGPNASPAKLAIARTIATLQAQMSTLSDRFASSQGGSPEDIALFLKISGTVGELLQSVGLGKTLQEPVRAKEDDGAHDEIVAAYVRVRDARKQDEAQGIFRDRRGNVITDPTRLALEKQIYNLKQQCDALENGTTIIDAAPAATVLTLPPMKTVSSTAKPPPAAAEVKTPEPPQPSEPPQPREPNSTEKFYEWSGGDVWSAGHHWPRLP